MKTSFSGTLFFPRASSDQNESIGTYKYRAVRAVATRLVMADENTDEDTASGEWQKG